MDSLWQETCARIRRRDERGATAVLISVLMSGVIMISAAFVIDLGQQRVLRRDIQAVADMVALDLSRLIDGRRAHEYDASVFDAAEAQSIGRNTSALGDEIDPADVHWEFVTYAADGAWVTVPSSSDEVPLALRVRVRSEVAFFFGAFTGKHRGGAETSAVAKAEKSACFRVGSFVASLDSTQAALLNPLLSALLGSTVNLDLISYQGLAAADVALLDLVEVAGLEAGTVDALLALDGIAVGELLAAAATVLDREGNLAAATILRSISVSTATPTISLGELFHAASGNEAALASSLNVLDLLTGAALVANGDHAVAVPDLGITLPGVANTTATLTVIEAPRTACGPVGTTLETAQVRLDLAAHIDPQLLSVALLGTNVEVGAIDLAVSIDLGKALARLASVTCGDSGPESIGVDLSSAVVGGVTLHGTASIAATVDPTGSLLDLVLDLLGVGSLLKPPYLTLDSAVSIDASSADLSGYNQTVTVALPEGYTTPTGSGSGNLNGTVAVEPAVETDLVLHYWDGLLGPWKELHITDPLNEVFASVLGPITDAIVGDIVNPVLDALESQLVGPLGELLGLQVGGADVFAALPPPQCGGPTLIG